MAAPVVAGAEDPPALSVSVMASAAEDDKVSESVAETLEASVAEAVAPLVKVPVADGEMVAVTV